MTVLDKISSSQISLKHLRMIKMVKMLTGKNTQEAWLLNQKKVCTMTLSFCLILTLFILVSSESTMFVSVSLIDLEFHCPNFTRQKKSTSKRKQETKLSKKKKSHK